MSTRISCKLDSDGNICLQDILESFNSPIPEEHAWALCYQGCQVYLGTNNPENIVSVNNPSKVYLHVDGNFSRKTFVCNENIPLKKVKNEQHFLSNLGVIIFKSLDHACSGERTIGKELDLLINELLSNDQEHHNETDDEGIENDSCHIEQAKLTIGDVIHRCERHLPDLTKAKVESHYKAVIRAFITEALELVAFLDKVSQGTGSLLCSTSPASNVSQLQFADWARLWVQVIAELRSGVKLRKVIYGRAPIEYELTPYEILMKDIRSCRNNLKKIMINGDVPHRVTKDAHDIILEFIRSRPPLKKASDRKLMPRIIMLTPREKLLKSIQKGQQLRPVNRNIPRLKLESSYEQQPIRKLIKIDYSQLEDYYNDDDDEDEDVGLADYGAALEAYDLATPSFDISYTNRRHTLGVIEQPWGSQSVPQSRPSSRQSCNSSDTDSIAPEMSQSLQDRLFGTNTGNSWPENMSLEDRLSLTLEEIVHIRTVLTKAELESLPVDCHVRGDVEKRKVCFLCLKTRFGIFGPWGQRCCICKRSVCSKCYTRMNIPMEHFTGVPVALLSPSILATPEDDSQSGSSRATPEPPKNNLGSLEQQPLRLRSSVVDKFKNPQLAVCNDCKMMLQQIIKAARTNRTALRNKTLQNLSLNLSPVF